MIPLDRMPAYYNQTFMYQLVAAGNEIARLNALDLAAKYIDARICQYYNVFQLRFIVALSNVNIH